MTEIEELIEQAKATLKRWRKPNPEAHISKRPWQGILDNSPYPHLNVKKL